MRDTKQILRSSCMSCDCEEFKLKSSSNQCSVCNCYATSHYKVDEIAGAFDIPHVEIKKGTTTSSWFGRQKKRPTTSSSKHFQWYSINGVESITLTMTQQQIFLGVLGLAILVFTGILLPLRTGLALGSLFRLRFNSFIVFATTAFMAFRAFRITKLISKQVTCAALVGINVWLATCYLLMGLGVFPRLYSSYGQLSVEPARYITWLVIVPILCHLTSDITSNNKDMTWFSRISYISLISMFFGQLSPNSTLLLTIELATISLVLYGLNRLFHQLTEEERMMDKASTFLARSMVLIGLFIIQATWMLETCDLIGFSVAEVSKTVADIVMISGLTMTIAFADLKELQAL